MINARPKIVSDVDLKSHQLYFLDDGKDFDGEADKMLVRAAEPSDHNFIVCELCRELPNRFASRNTNKHVFTDVVQNNPTHVLAYKDSPKVIIAFSIAHTKATIVYTIKPLRGHGFAKYLMGSASAVRS